MDLPLRTGSWVTAAADWLIVPVTEPVELAGPWLELNIALGEQLVRLVESEDLTGKGGIDGGDCEACSASRRNECCSSDSASRRN